MRATRKVGYSLSIIYPNTREQDIKKMLEQCPLCLRNPE